MLSFTLPDTKAFYADAKDEVSGIRFADVDNVAKVDTVADLLTHPSSLGEIRQGVSKHFYSDGAFNLIQLLIYIIKQTGPAHVWLTTYSISDDSIKVLKQKVECGDILSIRFLIDNRVRSMSPKNFDLLVGCFPGCYRCRALHAKVALIYNDEWAVTLIGSQNATRNPKLERGIIHTDRTIFEFDKKILTDEFDKGTT